MNTTLHQQSNPSPARLIAALAALFSVAALAPAHAADWKRYDVACTVTKLDPDAKEIKIVYAANDEPAATLAFTCSKNTPVTYNITGTSSTSGTTYEVKSVKTSGTFSVSLYTTMCQSLISAVNGINVVTVKK